MTTYITGSEGVTVPQSFQVGSNATPTNNFTISAAAANGNLTIARGNTGVTSQNVLTVDSTGNVNFPVGMTIAGTSGQRMMLTASQATTSGTSIDFTGIPSWAKKITVTLNNISAAAAGDSPHFNVQVGAGSIQTTGYSSYSTYSGYNSSSGASATSGMIIYHTNAAGIHVGSLQLTQVSSTVWVSSHATAINLSSVYYSVCGGGSVTLTGGAIDRIRLTTVSGTDSFTAGSVSLLIEGY